MRACAPRWPCLTAFAALLGCVDLTPPKGVGMLTAGASGSGGSAGGDARETGAAGEMGTADTGDGPGDTPDTGDAPTPSEGGSIEDPLPNGRPCTHGGQCYSGFCVEGVCCVSECSGTCLTCKVSGSEGMCLPAPAGEDPRDQCIQMPPASCGQDGTCNGAGACRQYVAGSECAPGSCSGSTEQAASTCDGAGNCRPGSSRNCAPVTCQVGSCGTACSSDSQCLTGFFCEATACRPKRAQGAACSQAAECATGNCVDGVCCNSACSATCHACNLTGSPGTCTAVAAGSDPGNECAATDPGTCGTTGACNGAGACALHPAGTSCGQAATCSNNTETSGRTCNGLGTCLAPTMRACSPYVCGATSCATTCSGGAQCQTGYVCTNGACVMNGGGSANLVMDDFSDTNLRSNTMGGAVTWDNANVSLVNGEQKFVWNGSGVFHDFIETFKSNWCEHNLTGYTKLRFRMRSSVASKRVEIYLGIGNGSCGVGFENRVNTITLTTTMSTYEIDISRTTRDKARTVEFAPTTTDSTEYFLDDITLVP